MKTKLVLTFLVVAVASLGVLDIAFDDDDGAVAIDISMVSTAAADSETEEAKEKFSGTFVSKNDVAQDREMIDEAIEKLVDDMRFYERRFARSSLEDSTTPCPQFDIDFDDDDAMVKCQGRKATNSPIDGTIVDWTNEDGDDHRLSQTLESDRFVQVFRTDDGKRTNVYTLRDDGNELVKSVTLTSDRLPRDLEYQRVFRRR